MLGQSITIDIGMDSSAANVAPRGQGPALGPSPARAGTHSQDGWCDQSGDFVHEVLRRTAPATSTSGASFRSRRRSPQLHATSERLASGRYTGRAHRRATLQGGVGHAAHTLMFRNRYVLHKQKIRFESDGACLPVPAHTEQKQPFRWSTYCPLFTINRGNCSTGDWSRLAVQCSLAYVSLTSCGRRQMYLCAQRAMRMLCIDPRVSSGAARVSLARPARVHRVPLGCVARASLGAAQAALGVAPRAPAGRRAGPVKRRPRAGTSQAAAVAEPTR